MTNVLLSIKPQYAQSIIKGDKKFELRKSVFKDRTIESVYIYVTVPLCQVVACFKVGQILEGTPSVLWEKVKQSSGISYKDFAHYFEYSAKAYAIEITNLKVFDKPINPKEVMSDFKAPRSFMYIDGQFANFK